jgi:hypothetical protein
MSLTNVSDSVSFKRQSSGDNVVHFIEVGGSYQKLPYWVVFFLNLYQVDHTHQ